MRNSKLPGCCSLTPLPFSSGNNGAKRKMFHLIALERVVTETSCISSYAVKANFVAILVFSFVTSATFIGRLSC